MNRFSLVAFVFALIVVSQLASSQNLTDWVFREVGFMGSPDMTPSLSYSEATLLKVESTKNSNGVFKLSTTIPHPAGNAWELSAKVKISAPEIDLDMEGNLIQGRPEEREENDGPNFFAFIYGYEVPTVEKPGFITSTYSFFAYPTPNSSLCHAHFECNWAGDPSSYYGYYCSSGSENMREAWTADGSDLSFASGYSTFGDEPFTQDEWKTIELTVNAGECMHDSLTIVFMGVDAFSDKEYTWEIKDVTITGESTTKLSLESTYDMSEKAYLERPAYCGNGNKDSGEQCDGTDGVSKGYNCTTACILQTVCGDGLVVGSEVCDSSNVTKGYKCSSNCTSKSAICGDGLIVGEELCDPKATNASSNFTQGFECASDCKSMVPDCGDGVLVGTEECDGTNGTNNYTACSSDCKLYRLLSQEENSTIQTIFNLANQSKPGAPVTAQINFTSRGSVGLGDLSEQIQLMNINWLPANYSFQFCVEGTTQCEESFYMRPSSKVYASNQTMAFKEARGSMKLYSAAIDNKTTYFIGFKVEGESQPLLGDMGGWVIAVGSLLVVGVLLLVVTFLVVLHFKKIKKTPKPEPKEKKPIIPQGAKEI